MKTTAHGLGLGVFTSVICLLVAACGSSDSSETPAAGGTGAASGAGGASGKGGSAGVGGGGTGGVAGKGGTSGSSGTGGVAGTAGVAGTGGSAGATCGNSKVESPEECDQGTSNSDTGACTTKCKSAKCGDSLVQDGVEDCDQGASNSDTGACTTKCKSAKCGDSLVQAGAEECDQGAANADTGACTSTCKNAKCGDSLVQAGVEGCDLGAANSDTGACTSQCKSAKCGDSLVQATVEDCDLGAANSDTGACTSLCKNAACGDGLLQTGVEECDQGTNNNDQGACTLQCKNAKCGDGLTEIGVEECDQGTNNNDQGACTVACKSAKCGDSLLQVGVEECDLGANNSNTGTCTTLCKNAVCGDGFVKAGSTEACDDGNQVNGDGCNNDCVVSGTPLFTKSDQTADAWYGATKDPSGNIIVTGAVFVTGQGQNAITQKLDANGNILWTKTYNAPANGNDAGNAVATDAQGNVIVVGNLTSAGGGTDILVIKYDANGNQVWIQAYTGDTANTAGNDYGFGVATNAAGDIFLTGAVFPSTANYDVIVAKLAGVNGSLVWADVVNGTASSSDFGAAIAVDGANVLVTGGIRNGASSDIWVRKYADAGASQTLTWTRTFNGLANGDDFGSGIATDSTGNVFVSGSETVTGHGQDIWVRKYDAAGNVAWTAASINGPGNLADEGLSVKVDSLGAIVVGGYVTNSNNTTDAWVQKYSSAGVALGAPAWPRTYNGAADGDDVVNAVVIDSTDFIYGVGTETITSTNLNGWIRKFAP